jgi:hypothetical protein
MSNIIAVNGNATVSVPANESIAVYTQGQAQVSRTQGYPNYPDVTTLLGTVTNGQTVFGPYSAGATIIVESVGSQPVLYEIGTDPQVQQWRLNQQVQGAPTNIADGGSMAFTVASLLSGIVTATPTAGRNIQLPTGAAMDLASEFAVNDSFDWSLITLAAFALTVTQGTSGHTIVGAPATAATSGSAARFRTRKTAANTFVTYRIA